MNTTNDTFSLQSPLARSILLPLGVYLVITFILCIHLNATLLYIFYRYRKLQTPVNKLICIVTLFNLIASAQFPIVIHSTFEQRYKYLKTFF